jgi:long-chain acyl-CoA synthetase
LAEQPVLAIYEEAVGRRLVNVSCEEQVRKFVLLDRPFSIEADELTPTLKMRRAAIYDHFSEQIVSLYADGA